MKKIMVIGAGTMGLDIAQVFASGGFSVIVRDIKEEILERAKVRLDKTLSRQVAKGRMAVETKELIQSRMIFITDNHMTNTEVFHKVEDVDLVVEAAVERLDIKRSIFAELDNICKPETIFATNTSSISITAIASSTSRADRFIGMHFFNPAPVMKLVEVIRGEGTSDETCNAIREVCDQIGKTMVEVKEAPGFVVNRILVPMINEAAGIYAEGIATAEDIDTAMKFGANHPIGPLALGDMIGLDIVLAVMEVLQAETGDPKYRPHPILRKMVRAKKLGVKTGEGFYQY